MSDNACLREVDHSFVLQSGPLSAKCKKSDIGPLHSALLPVRETRYSSQFGRPWSSNSNAGVVPALLEVNSVVRKINFHRSQAANCA